MNTPDNPLIDAVHERGCPALGGYGHGKEACACSAEETQADKLRTLAAAADKHGQHIYTHPRDSNAYKANEAWCRAASPELVVGLLDRIAELEAQQARKPLTDEQIDALWGGENVTLPQIINRRAISRSIERAHGIQEQA